MSLLTLPGRLSRPLIDFAAGAADDGGLLLLSMRQVADLVGYCALYEFEDVIAAVTGADVANLAEFEPLDLSRKVYKLARYMTGSSRLADTVTPTLGSLVLHRKYDLFLPIFNHPHELFALHALDGWRDQCRFAACYLCEAWNTQLPRYLLELLKSFDHIFIGVYDAIDTVARITGRPCSYLPMGVDTLKFCPYPVQAHRAIDVCGIGRRSRVTHESLLRWAADKQAFYYYDTMQSGAARGRSGKNMTFRVNDPREHRTLLSNLLKRSRYFIANRAWADRPALTLGRDEIAARFYEGAAAGTIMLGDPPNSDDFRSQFDWPDSVFRMPFDAPNVGEVIAEIEDDPGRSARIRWRSVVESLRRHDWVYRLRRILEVAGLAPSEKLLEREARLQSLADEIARVAA
jgi:hypothetical protein